MAFLKEKWQALRVNQYGYEVDVFDKYREAVRKNTADSLRVFSVSAIVSAMLVFIYLLTHGGHIPSAVFSGFLLIAGIVGARVAFRKNSDRKHLKAMTYVIAAVYYILAIYGSTQLGITAFWIGTQLAVTCYILDYAGHIVLLQTVGYMLALLAWDVTGMVVDDTRILFSLVFWAASIVSSYTMNRSKLSLILGREESQRQAETDLLTGLTMRTAAQQEIEDHLKTDEHGVMMLLDLDRFKSVNDRLGHQMGDKVLIEVAADLKKMFRNSDVLSRLGGDEFVVYMKSVPEKEWALQRASAVVREVRRWVGNGTTNVQISASVGIVMTDMVNRTYDDLYRAADVAMYRAKKEGGNKALFFSPDMMSDREAQEVTWECGGSCRDGEREETR